LSRFVHSAWCNIVLAVVGVLVFGSTLSAQQTFSPHWQSLPWDSGGYDPSSVVWSMVQSELDVDQDGKKEFLLTTSWSGSYYNMVYLYEAVGNDSFAIVWSYSFYPYSSDFSAVTVSDLNNNNRQEILCLVDPADTTYHGFYVFEWEGNDNSFPTVPTATWDFGLGHWFHEGTAIIADDLDNDGKQEVAVSFVEDWNTYKSKVMIFSCSSTTITDSSWQIEFVDSTTMPVVGYSLTSTDLDRDNRRELVVVGWDTLRVTIYENTGSANSYTLSANIKNLSYYLDVANDGVVEANYDNDGTNELYLITGNGALFVATNDGDVSHMTALNFTWIGQYDYYKGMIGMTKADLNGDTIPELYLAGSYNEAVYRVEYAGGSVTDYNNYLYSTVFMDDTTDDHTSDSTDQGYFRPTKIAAGDFDGDGFADMIVSSASFAADKPMLMFLEDNNQVGVNVNAGWNIVSVPKTVVDGNKATLFPQASSSAFSFTSGSYQQKTSLNNGVGYWLKFPSSATLTIPGIERLTDSIDVVAGWNMIGSISNNVPVTSIRTVPDGILASNMFGYKSGYSTVEEIEPGKGYWIKISSAGKIILQSTVIAKTSYTDIVTKKHDQPLARKTFTRGERLQ